MNLLNIDDLVADAGFFDLARHRYELAEAAKRLAVVAGDLHDRLMMTPPNRRAPYNRARNALDAAHPLRLESMLTAIREIEAALAGELPEQ